MFTIYFLLIISNIYLILLITLQIITTIKLLMFCLSNSLKFVILTGGVGRCFIFAFILWCPIMVEVIFVFYYELLKVVVVIKTNNQNLNIILPTVVLFLTNNCIFHILRFDLLFDFLNLKSLAKFHVFQWRWEGRRGGVDHLILT